MSNYLMELSLIHITLVLGYLIFLKNERQYHKMRLYLVVVTILALTIPLLKLPKLFSGPQDPIISGVITLSTTTLTPTPEVSSWQQEILVWAYLAISSLFLFKLSSSLFVLFRLKYQSRYQQFNDLYIRKVRDINGSFTFFHWIFLNEDIDENNRDYQAILEHEKAHAALGHTYDLLFFELFKVCFWWLPTAWFINQEIRKIHEYQADAYAIKWCHIDKYSSILISSTLKTNGLSLASSFHDGLILKRLTAMKQQAKNVSPWKLGALLALCTSLIIVFACSEDPDTKSVDLDIPEGKSEEKVFEVVEQLPEFEGGMEAFYKYIGREMKYPLQARKMGIEGKVFVQFVVEKDGSLSGVQALKGIGAGCDQEAVRVLESVPAFKPGAQRGRPVRVKMVLPVVFKLNHGKTNPDNTTQGMIILDEVSADLLKLQVKADYHQGVWSGTVYDEQGYGLPGANIIVAGTNTGAVSGMDGTFKFEADDPNDLLISFVGYETVRLTAN